MLGKLKLISRRSTVALKKLTGEAIRNAWKRSKRKEPMSSLQKIDFKSMKVTMVIFKETRKRLQLHLSFLKGHWHLSKMRCISVRPS